MKTTSISLLLGVCFLFVSGASAKGGYIEVGDATAGSCATITNSFQGVTTYTSSGNDDAKCYCGNNMMPDAAYPAGTTCECNDPEMMIETTENDEDGNQQPFCKCGTGKKVNADGDACEDDGAPTAATPAAGGGGATPAAPAGGGGATPADDTASTDDAADDDKDAATSMKPSTLIYPLLICFSFKMMSL